MIYTVALILPLLSTYHSPAADTRVAARAQAEPQHPAERAWTVLFYGASDNDSEQSFVPDMRRLAEGFAAGDAVELLFFVDRSSDYSSRPGPFGEDFADSRLYRFDGERAVRLAGGAAFPEITTEASYEANTGDAHTLQKALRFAKTNYPAQRTALVFYSHGGGESWCPDESSGGDRLWTSELTRVLSDRESVDLLVFDVCSMAALENAYQWRPGTGRFSADVMLATPNAGFPFPWGRVFRRIRAGAAPEGEPGWLAPDALDAADLARLVIEETRAARLAEIESHPQHAEMIGGEAMVCLDLAHAQRAKSALDSLARELAAADVKRAIEALRGEGDETPTMNYFVPGENSWLSMPYFDLYDLAGRIAREPGLDDAVREHAESVREAVDGLVVDSFGLAGYERFGGFEPGKNGVYVVFPDGDAVFDGRRAWERFGWYHPLPSPEGSPAPGDYAFCRDGATPGDGAVDNWYELLDSWYDTDNEQGGGVNGYRW